MVHPSAATTSSTPVTASSSAHSFCTQRRLLLQQRRSLTSTRSSIPSCSLTPTHHHYHPTVRPSLAGTRGIITGTYPATPLHSFNKKLLALSRNPDTCLPIFDKCRELLESKLTPDLTTYNVLLEAHERNNDPEGILRTLEEMELAGIEMSISSFNIGLRSAAVLGDIIVLEKIRTKIEQAGLKMNITSYEYILQGLCNSLELEHALDLLGDMTVAVNEKGEPDENGKPVIDVRPSQQCYILVIRLAQSLHESETAYMILKMAEVQSGLSRIPAVVYLDLLARAAEDYELPAVEYCWKKAVKESGATVDEGTCMLVLNCAGHEKAPRLSAEVIQHMGECGMEFQEYHFAPLFQSFSLSKKFKSAFNVLSIMRSSGMKPNILTATSLLKVMDDSADVEDAFVCMQEMHREGKAVDVVAFNILIEACGRNKDVTRAMSIFEAASDLGVETDTDTYNALLTGCIADKNMTEGKKVIARMQDAGVDPNVDTYQSLISLCLTQINYEDAFVYLEEMKSHNVIPSEPIYTRLVRKLARENDPRIQYAVEEMESFGYVVGPNLREYIETGGLSNLEESERRKQIRLAQRRRSGHRWQA
ncbi:hypothetical protein EDD11_001523 [Mortierella claussenii]|nr:hypothetical protein EDD11_001523 [Mortierella claussenii]